MARPQNESLAIIFAKNIQIQKYIISYLNKNQIVVL